MKRTHIVWMIVLAIGSQIGCQKVVQSEDLYLYDLNLRKTFSGEHAARQLQDARFVLVGEHHDNAWHHQAQLAVIQLLHSQGRKVAIGLEMFRRDSQSDLDGWTAGKIAKDKFKPIYLDNWNYGWDLYRSIFDYAQNHRIPMVGLNVSRKITAQVASQGFESLSDTQKGSLDGITCNVTSEYREFIQRAYGAHGHGHMDFGRFCEAQLVWDTVMAVHALEYLRENQADVIVILAGSGHARKMAIPAQLEKRTPWRFVVVLPETPGVFDANTTSVQDADFIILSN